MDSLAYPIFQPAGESALLVTLGAQIDPSTNRRVHALARLLAARGTAGIGEAVPGYAALLVHYDPLVLGYAEAVGILAGCLEQLDEGGETGGRLVEIPVHYGGGDGPDLDFVAEHNNLRPEDVVRMHSGRDYPVYLMGFTPGFPYLGGLDPAIAAPRLGTPRARVPGGSVGIAGEQTGIYPLESPGGWRIIGRTDLALFNPRREPPSLLSPGDVVRFLPVDALVGADSAPGRDAGSQSPPPAGGLFVQSPGLLVTIQDRGRSGCERLGVPPAGALDWLALHAANLLVGNDPGAAGLEFALQAPGLVTTCDCLVACAGRGWQMLVGGREVGGWRAALAREGEEITFAGEGETGWGYLAASGGLNTELVMGSRSTYLRGGFGGLDGRPLREGDELPLGAFPRSRLGLAGRRLRPDARPRYASQIRVPVVIGPQADVFGDTGLQAFLSAEYAITSTSDRMGYRLSGPAVQRRVKGELLSEGIAPGSVQVPPDGQPIVLLAERPTTGGYAKIATAARAGLPLLVQAMPGSGRVRFFSVSVDEACARLRADLEILEGGIEDDED